MVYRGLKQNNVEAFFREHEDERQTVWKEERKREREGENRARVGKELKTWMEKKGVEQ